MEPKIFGWVYGWFLWGLQLCASFIINDRCAAVGTCLPLMVERNGNPGKPKCSQDFQQIIVLLTMQTFPFNSVSPSYMCIPIPFISLRNAEIVKTALPYKALFVFW